MTRNEIINELNYKGEYTKEVKRKLNSLIKKYHPDKNKDDKKTILLLYKIKEELEKGTLKYNKTPDKKIINKNDGIVSESKDYKYFIGIINGLKEQRERINKRISSVIKKINKNIELKNKRQDDLSRIECEVENIKDELNDLTKIDYLDKIIIVFIIALCFLSIILKKYLFILGGVALMVLEVYYVYVRYKNYDYVVERLNKTDKKRMDISKNCNLINDNLKKLEKEELSLKREIHKIDNEIQYYNNEINKLYSKKDIHEKEDNKVFVKK